MSNPPSQKVDFLIIGQGLAGSLLAWELNQRGQRVIVVDNGNTSASQVAAGLINPITGIRLVKNPDIDFLLPAAKKYYQDLSIFFNQDFLIEKPMLRLLRTQQENQYCKKRLTDPNYRAYLSGLKPAIADLNLITPYGILEQKQTGFLKIKPLLSKIKNYLQQTHQYLTTVFNYRDLTIQTNNFQWQNIKASRIIFCEGYQAQNNPWFSWLPFNLAKGEILTLDSPTCIPEFILNYGFWVIPTGNHKFRTGATFDRDNIDTKTTIQARNTLIQSLNQYVPVFLTNHIINHQAQIRPATIDRQPFLGNHPKRPELLIFNGFGAKGSLLIPWFVRQFSDHLINSSPLPEKTNIDRHYDKYFPKS